MHPYTTSFPDRVKIIQLKAIKFKFGQHLNVSVCNWNSFLNILVLVHTKIRAMAKWSSKKHGKILCALFDEGLADHRHKAASDIDPIRELRDEFKDTPEKRFRENYKNTATMWISGKAVEGTQRKLRE